MARESMTTGRYTLSSVNQMTADEFVHAFGDVAEHSAWVAQSAAEHRPYGSRQAMVEAFAQAASNADSARQLALLRAHPDLASRATLRESLTDDSQREQASAGLQSLAPDEFARFNELNERYRSKFGFPFIFAVKGADKHTILSAFETRIENTAAQERTIALEQVFRIFGFRIEERVDA